MPYIKKDDRDKYNKGLDTINEVLSRNSFPVGDVTYVIYNILIHMFAFKKKYQTICEVRGILAGVLSEFDRRFAFPYEDEKIDLNGDVETKWYFDTKDNEDTRGGA
jgi:hypothetical protein